MALQAGTPEVKIEPIYNKKESKLELKITQNIPSTPKQKNKTYDYSFKILFIRR